MKSGMNLSAPRPPLRLYQDLAEWYPLLTPVADYAEESAFYMNLFKTYSKEQPRSLLDLGSGGGHNAAHLKRTLSCTLVDIAPAMLSLSSRLNPECDHVHGDMRSVRLGRVFDCVLVHDAISYMASRDDLGNTIATAFAHTAPGGVALFQPDFVAETFLPGTESGGSDSGGRGLRYLEWRWVPDGAPELYVTDMAYLLKDDNDDAEVVHDRHIMGLFPRSVWLDMMAGAGFEPRAIPFAHSSAVNTGHEVFLGIRPCANEGG